MEFDLVNEDIICLNEICEPNGPNVNPVTEPSVSYETRRGTITNFIEHPCDPSLKFWIIADVPHLLKNIVQGLRNNDIITFSDKIVKDYDLTGNTVRCKDIFDLFELQQNDSLKLAPKLKSHSFV